MSKVRTTQRPDVEIEVTDDERETLRRRGYLYEGNATTDEGARKAVERQQAQQQDQKTAG